MDVIYPAETEWAAPTLFVPKKDGTIRFSVDYHKLNAVTIPYSHPIPRMNECIATLGDTTSFSMLDAKSSYCQVEVANEDLDKTAFESSHGLFRFILLQFGLKTYPGWFDARWTSYYPW